MLGATVAVEARRTLRRVPEPPPAHVRAGGAPLLRERGEFLAQPAPRRLVERALAQDAVRVDHEVVVAIRFVLHVAAIHPREHVAVDHVRARDRARIELRAQLAVHLVPRPADLRAQPALRGRELVVEHLVDAAARRHRELVGVTVVSGHAIEPRARRCTLVAVRLPAIPAVAVVAPALDDGARQIFARHKLSLGRRLAVSRRPTDGDRWSQRQRICRRTESCVPSMGMDLRTAAAIVKDDLASLSRRT